MTDIWGGRGTWRHGGALIGALIVASATIGQGAHTAAAQQTFAPGKGTATALGYKVNPVFGNLSFGITTGVSLAVHQNSFAQSESRSVDLGVIGTTLAGEGCDGGAPTFASEDQPQPVQASSTIPGDAAGKTESEQGLVTKHARANADPYAEAVTTIAPMGDPLVAQIGGGTTTASSGVIDGSYREARAVTEIGEIRFAAGLVTLGGLRWEAIHRTGSKNESIGTFSIGSATLAGSPLSLPSDGIEQVRVLNTALGPLGLQFVPPVIRTANGIVFVDPMKVGFIESQLRDGLVGALLGAAQPFRQALTDALLAQDCGNSTYITVLDIALGTFSGAGRLNLELGGVQASTSTIDAFKFPLAPPLGSTIELAPELIPPVDTFTTPGTPSVALPATAEQTLDRAGRPSRAQPVASLDGARGGALAAISAGGLFFLLGMADGDRRKMRRAQRSAVKES